MALSFTTQIGLGLVLAGAAFFVFRTGGTEGVLEYVYVDKVVDNVAQYSGRTIKVHGTVVPGTVRQKVGAAGDYTFDIEKEGRRMPVHFTNMVPDTFAEGGEVVLTGRSSPGASSRRRWRPSVPRSTRSSPRPTPTASRGCVKKSCRSRPSGQPRFSCCSCSR